MWNSDLVQRNRTVNQDNAWEQRLWASVGAPLVPCIPCVSTSALARSFVPKGKDARPALLDKFHPALAEEPPWRNGIGVNRRPRVSFIKLNEPPRDALRLAVIIFASSAMTFGTGLAIRNIQSVLRG